VIKKKAAVVLCAGVGSRMGLPINVNKCAIQINETSAVRHTVVSLINIGCELIVIVVGHAQESVKEALREINVPGNCELQYVFNEYYGYHGCNYSVACGVLYAAERFNNVVITEGDSLLHPDSFRQVGCSDTNAALLIRAESFIDPGRSVVAIGIEGQINRHYYNQEHTEVLPALTSNEFILGESMQLWSYSDEPLQQLYLNLKAYKEMADKSKTPLLESGVFSINMVDSPIVPVISSNPTLWINLNTQDDLVKAREQEWLLG